MNTHNASFKHKMIVRLYLFVFCTFALGSAAPGKPHDDIPKCKRSDSNIDTCLKNAIQETFAKMVSGLPKFGVPSINPLKITEMDVAQEGGPVSIELKFRNLELFGLKNSIIDKVESDLKNYKITFNTFSNKPFEINSEYEVKGKVLVLPLVGKGKANFVFDEPKASYTIVGKPVTRNGKEYMEVTDFDVTYDTSKLQMHFEGLFSQDKSLSENINLFLNDNWRELHQELRPTFEKALSAVYKEMAIRFFSKVPFDEIFLP